MPRADLYKTRTQTPARNSGRPVVTGHFFDDVTPSKGTGTSMGPRTRRSQGLLNQSVGRARFAARQNVGAVGGDIGHFFDEIDQRAAGRAQKPGGALAALSEIPGIGAGLRGVGTVLNTEPVKRVLDVVDMPRALIVSGVKELTELEAIGGTEDNKSFWDQAKEHIGYGQVIESLVPEAPQWLKIGLGVTGDIGLDPLTYLGVGLGTEAAKGVGSAAKVAEGLDRAAELAKVPLSASRRQLAVQLAERAAEAGVNADKLIAEAGVRGRAALTEGSLARLGVTAEDKAALGIPEFGAHLKVGRGRTVSLGGRRAAEAIQEAKGSILERVGRAPGADLIRQVRNPADEVALTQTLLGGKGTFKQRADAAKILAVSSFRRGAGGKLEDQMHRWIMAEPEFKNLAKYDTTDILHGVEAGAKGPVEDAVAGFYDALLQAARQSGLDIPERANYIPHRLSEEAQAFISDPEAAKRAGVDLRKFRTERFEQARTLGPGDKFMGETLKDGTIAEINRIGREKGLDFDFLETDLPTLMQKSIGEAGRAAERHAITEQLVKYGLAEKADAISEQVVKLTRTEKRRVSDLGNLQEQALRRQRSAEATAARSRTKVVALLKRELERTKNKVRVSIDSLNQRVLESVKKTEDLSLRRDVAEQAHTTAQAALDEAKRAAGVARRSERRRALANVERLQKVVDERRINLEALHNEYRQATADTLAAEEMLKQVVELRKIEALRAAERSGRRIRLGGTVEGEAVRKAVAPQREAYFAAEQKAAGLSEQVVAETGARRAVEEARAAVPSGPVTSPAMEQAAGNLDKVRAEIGRLDQAGRDAVLERADSNEMLTQLEARERQIDEVLGKRTETRNTSLNRKKAELLELSDRSKLLREVLGDDTREAIDHSIATMEAKAVAAEMDAAHYGDEAAMRGDIIKSLKNDKVREIIKHKIGKGMIEFAPGYQTDPQTAQALKNLISVFDDKTALNGALREWDKVVGWTKTWMVSTPGFVLRNLYGGVFNNLIAGVKHADYREFMHDFRIYQKDPIGYAAKIAAEGRDVERFQAALDSIASTGWGQSAQEAARQTFKGERRSVPVFGSDNRYSRAVRAKNEQVEDLLRGSHAYSVLRRGGTTQDAIDSVARWHFNYRDISDFDRGVKRVIPFWVFTSRNIPLQLSVLASKPHLVNRYLGNIQRELEQQSSPEGIVPDYFKTLGAIRLPFQVPGLDNQGATDYLLPDLPIERLNEDLGRAVNPVEFLQDVIPELRVPLELKAGKQFFGDLPIEQGYQEAPAWAKVPVVQQLLQAVGAQRESASGPQMRGTTKYSIEQLLPFLGRAGRLTPTGGKDSTEALLSALFGVSLRANTDARQSGELLRRRREVENLINDLNSQRRKG